MSILEIIAVITGIACVFLQTKEIIWAWPLGIISVTVSIFIFYQSQLYSDVILHIVYIFLNLYGWYYWLVKRKSDQEEAPIKALSTKQFIGWGTIILIGAACWGYGMNRFTGTDLAYLDAFTTVGSLCAQYLLARKILHNWIFWIIVDVVAVNVYIYKELYFIAFLFFAYLILAIMGYIQWRKEYNQTTSTNITDHLIES